MRIPFRLAVGLVASAGVASAQPLPPKQLSPLERAEANRRVTEQVAIQQVREAIDQATKLARSHPEKASLDLKRLRFSLATRTDLGSAKQTELFGLLDTAIRGVTTGGTKPVATLDPRLILRNEQNRKAFDEAQVETKEVREAVTAIARDEADGKLADARIRVANLKAKYPTNAAVIQLTELGLVRDNIAEAKSLTEEMNRRVVASLNGVERSALPAVRDMEFPPDWKEISERRRKLTQVQLGEEEEALLRALETQITVPMKGQPFEESIQTLSNAIGKNLYVDQKSFDSLGMDMRRLVDVPANVSARTALRAMLQSVGMTFIIRDKIIKVVSVEEARKNMMTRSYEIRDLIQSGGPFNGGATWGPYIDYLQTQKNAEMLVESIMMSVDPNAWSNRGGPSSILFHYPTMSIVVRAPSEVHYSLGLAMYGDGKKKK
jgi:hypothetical protein